MPPRGVVPQSFPYFGGKKIVASQIVSLLTPPGEVRRFVDACCGSAAIAVAYHRRWAPHSTVINDVDDEIYNFYRVLREDGDELVRRLALTPNSKTDFVAAKSALDHPPPADAVERARLFYVRACQQFSAAHTSTTWRRSRKVPPCPGRVWSNGVDKVAVFAKAIRHFVVENDDVLVCADRYAGEGVLIYLDPPYPPATRKSGGYGVDQSGEWHERLLACAAELPGWCAISSYRNKLYDEALSGWRCYEFPAVAWSAASSAKETRTEALYCNWTLE